MARATALEFDALRLEGALFSPDHLHRVARMQAEAQSEKDYEIPAGLKIRDELGRAFRIGRALWDEFVLARARTDHPEHEAATHFVTALLAQAFGFVDLAAVPVQEISGRRYPIGQRARGRVPVVIAPHALDLDAGDARFADTRRRSATQLAQEYLNASNESAWAIVANGPRLRLLADSASLTRPAYLEADLERIFAEDRYPDFSALWLALHASRFGAPGTPGTDCVLERWRRASAEQGTAARRKLRDGVTEALLVLGNGFVQHAANTALREALHAGRLEPEEYFQQLLRLVYRLIFLFTVEDRGLLHPPGSDAQAQQLYRDGYGTQRLRNRALRRAGYDRHADLWQGLVIVFRALAHGEPALALPALGGLYAEAQCPDLDGAQLANRDLLQAVQQLGWFRDGAALSRVRYIDMGSEELGSVYESLLELEPKIELHARHFELEGPDETAKGSARKLTGSYYTHDSLVQHLLKTVLEPTIESQLAAHPDRPVDALLALSIVDPACGSGHFLLAAARRVAERVALLRSEGHPRVEDYRHALRDVISHCVFGVDRNPMALELARMALWLEAYTADAPLTFIDHHLVCGDALLGVSDLSALLDGIPDDAFKPLAADNKEVCRVVKSENRKQRSALAALLKTDSQQALSLDLEAVAADLTELDTLPDETLHDVETKRRRYVQFMAAAADLTSDRGHLQTACDLYMHAYFCRKQNADLTPTTQDVVNALLGQPTVVKGSEARASAREHRFLHWPLAFSQVFRQGGFSCVIGNPPWDVVQAKEDDEREIETHERGKNFFGSSNYGILSGRRDLYKLFILTVSRLIAPGGRFGLVVPVGFLFEEDSERLRQRLFQEFGFERVLHAQNQGKSFFPAVHASYRFVAMTVARSRASTHAFSIVAKRPAEVAAVNWVSVPFDRVVERLGPSRSGALFDSIAHMELHHGIARRLGAHLQLSYDVVAEFHVSTDKALLTTRRSSPSDWALLKSGSIHHYQPNFGPVDRYVARSAVVERLRRKGLDPDQWIASPRLVFRDQARNDDSRTLICCLVPPGVASTYDAPMIVPRESRHQSEAALAFYAAYLSSFVADFLIRPFVDKHVKGYVLARIPIPSFEPTDPEMVRVSNVSLELFRAFREPEQDLAWRKYAQDLTLRLEAGIAQLAGLDPESYAELLDSFRAIRDSEERQHGRYALKETLVALLTDVGSVCRSG